MFSWWSASNSITFVLSLGFVQSNISCWLSVMSGSKLSVDLSPMTKPSISLSSQSLQSLSALDDSSSRDLQCSSVVKPFWWFFLAGCYLLGHLTGRFTGLWSGLKEDSRNSSADPLSIIQHYDKLTITFSIIIIFRFGDDRTKNTYSVGLFHILDHALN